MLLKVMLIPETSSPVADLTRGANPATQSKTITVYENINYHGKGAGNIVRVYLQGVPNEMHNLANFNFKTA